MKKALCCFLLLVLLRLLSGCSKENPAIPTVAPSDLASTQSVQAQPALTPEPPARAFTDEKPALPYLRVSHYVNGEYVSGYIALTAEDAAQAARETADVDVADTVEVFTAENPDGSYGLMPPLYAQLAAECAGFYAQSPEDIGEIVSAAMTITQFGETRSQTVTDAASLKRLETILRGAERINHTGCPWTGILLLTMADSTTMTIQKATDSCQTMLFGTAYCYKISREDNDWLWSLFCEAAPIL